MKGLGKIAVFALLFLTVSTRPAQAVLDPVLDLVAIYAALSVGFGALHGTACEQEFQRFSDSFYSAFTSCSRKKLLTLKADLERIKTLFEECKATSLTDTVGKALTFQFQGFSIGKLGIAINDLDLKTYSCGGAVYNIGTDAIAGYGCNPDLEEEACAGKTGLGHVEAYARKCMECVIVGATPGAKSKNFGQCRYKDPLPLECEIKRLTRKEEAAETRRQTEQNKNKLILEH